MREKSREHNPRERQRVFVRWINLTHAAQPAAHFTREGPQLSPFFHGRVPVDHAAYKLRAVSRRCARYKINATTIREGKRTSVAIEANRSVEANG
jgi:hypothetical protein